MRVLSVGALLGLSAALAACSFRIGGVEVQSPIVDLAVVDLASVDLAVDDLSLPPAPDLAQDLAAVVDLDSVDLSTPPVDLAGADLRSTVTGFPAHVAYHYLVDSAADWTIAQHTTIDTGALTISTPTPAGVVFVADGPYAVLALHRLSIGTQQQSDVRVQVVGNRPLVIVAGDEIHVWGLLDAGARRDLPGPGGARPAAGDGRGDSANVLRGGGGGASYGTGGGAGGSQPKTQAGAIYGDSPLTVFAGGSGGGAGRTGEKRVRMNCTSPARGGAGGGVLQLSARKIVVEPATNGARGTVSVAGGGGSGGCAAKDDGAGGGGGGSGGALWIEAPALKLDGRLTAAGGGGGGGSSVSGTNDPPAYLDGADGYDGFVAALPYLSSLGGAGLSSGGSGYNGYLSPSPTAYAGAWNGLPLAHNGGGGGGGGGGRIRVRAATALNPSATPAASVVVELPSTIP